MSKLEQKLLQIKKSERAERRCMDMEAEMLVGLVGKPLYFAVDDVQDYRDHPSIDYVGFLDSVGNNFLKFRNVIGIPEIYDGYSQVCSKEMYKRVIGERIGYDSIEEFVANQKGLTIIKNKRHIATLIELK